VVVVVQLVQQITTGWTVWWSNFFWGEIFHTSPGRHRDPPSPLYRGYWVKFSGGKAGRVWR